MEIPIYQKISINNNDKDVINIPKNNETIMLCCRNGFVAETKMEI